MVNRFMRRRGSRVRLLIQGGWIRDVDILLARRVWRRSGIIAGGVADSGSVVSRATVAGNRKWVERVPVWPSRVGESVGTSL